jgi:hypothetical protein
LSHPVALSREGILPSTGNWTAAGCVVARKSWLALLRNVVHSLASWSIGRSFKAGSRAGRSVRREPFDADELALDAEQPLDGALRLHVVSFADVVVIDAAVRVDEVERRQWWLSKALQIS